MKKIYSKDECAPDALSAIDWLNQQIKGKKLPCIDFLNHPHIDVIHDIGRRYPSTIPNHPYINKIRYFAFNLVHYKIEYRGVYEELYEITLGELITEISKLAQDELANTAYCTPLFVN